MFTRPQILSTPHMIAPMGDTFNSACNYAYDGCPSGFGGSCFPWGGSGCIDTNYWVPTIVAGGIVIVVGGIAIAK
jgi:hypothetical protein